MASESEPVLSGGLLVVVGTDDCAKSSLTVAAVQADTGRLVWQRAVATRNPCAYDVPVHITAGIVVTGGRLGDSGPSPSACAMSGPAEAGPKAVGLDLKTGKHRWTAPTAAGLVLTATSDTLIARGARQGCLVGLDAATGRLRWTVTPPESPDGAATSSDSAFLEGQVAGGGVAVSAVDPGTGHERWQVALPPDRRGGIGPIAVGESVVAGTSVTVGLDPVTGQERWRTDEAHETMRISLRGPLLLANPGSQATVDARDARTGVRRWQSQSLPLLVGVASAAVTSGSAIVALTSRSAVALEASDGKTLWTTRGAFSAAAVTADSVYLSAPSTPRNRPQGG